VISEEFSKFLSVAGVFVNTKLEILAELFVEFLEVFSIFGYLLEELEALLGDVLLDDLQDFVVLEILSRDVEGEILGVNNTSDEAKIFRDEVFAVVHDEDSSDVEFDVVFLLLGFEHVEGSSLGDKDD